VSCGAYRAAILSGKMEYEFDRLHRARCRHGFIDKPIEPAQLRTIIANAPQR